MSITSDGPIFTYVHYDISYMGHRGRHRTFDQILLRCTTLPSLHTTCQMYSWYKSLQSEYKHYNFSNKDENSMKVLVHFWNMWCFRYMWQNNRIKVVRFETIVRSLVLFWILSEWCMVGNGGVCLYVWCNFSRK